MAGDAFLSTLSGQFSDTVVALVLKSVIPTLRAGLGYLPKGSVLPATYVKGTNATFRGVGYADLDPDGAVSIEDGQPDPDIEEVTLDVLEFTGTELARLVGVTVNAATRSPHDLNAIAAEKVARDFLVQVDQIARKAYWDAAEAGTSTLFNGVESNMDQVVAEDKLTADLVKRAVAILRASDVPTLQGGDYALLCHPFQEKDLRDDEDFVNEMKYADPSTFLTGATARFAGAQIVPTSRAIVDPTSGVSSADVYVATLIGAGSIFMGDVSTMEIHVTPPGGHEDPLHRTSLFAWKCLLGAVLNDNAGISTVSTPRYVNLATGSSF